MANCCENFKTALNKKYTHPALSKAIETSGFTLLEVLLALALGGILLTSVSIYVVSLANIWLNRGDADFFNQHVDGVTLFLSSSLSQSEGFDDEGADPVGWERPPGFNEFEDPLLTFRLRESPPLLAWDDIVFPGITGHLYFTEGEGLSLLWYSRLYEVEDIDDVRRTGVSPFVTKLSYCYYDEESEQWSVYEEPQEDQDSQFILPDFIKLQFEYDNEVREVPIYLPKRGQNVPIY